MTTPGQAATELRAWLESEGLEVVSGAGGAALDVTIPDSLGRTIRVVDLAASGLMTFSMVSTTEVPRSRWSALYPLLAEVNASIAMGAWILDPESGLLIYRMALPTRGAAYEPQALRDVISHVATLVSTFEDALTQAASDAAAPSWAAEDG